MNAICKKTIKLYLQEKQCLCKEHKHCHNPTQEELKRFCKYLNNQVTLTEKIIKLLDRVAEIKAKLYEPKIYMLKKEFKKIFEREIDKLNDNTAALVIAQFDNGYIRYNKNFEVVETLEEALS